MILLRYTTPRVMKLIYIYANCSFCKYSDFKNGHAKRLQNSEAIIGIYNVACRAWYGKSALLTLRTFLLVPPLLPVHSLALFPAVPDLAAAGAVEKLHLSA